MGKLTEAGTKPVVDTADKAMDGVEATLNELKEALRATADAPIGVVDATATEALSQLSNLRKEYMDVAKRALRVLTDLSPV